MESAHQVHPFPPLWDEHSRILILGSFPSIKSREQRFFYGHPQNRFWPLLARLLKEEAPRTIEEKRAMVLKHHIALWDSIASCDIVGSSDSSIRNVVANDFTPILQGADIQQIFTNGTKSHEIYTKYVEPKTGRKAVKLPSTSPANAAWQMDRLEEGWKVILPYLEAKS